MTQPDQPPVPDDHRSRSGDDPSPPASWVDELDPPATEAERQVQATVRSVSRLEESS